MGRKLTREAGNFVRSWEHARLRWEDVVKAGEVPGEDLLAGVESQNLNGPMRVVKRWAEVDAGQRAVIEGARQRVVVVDKTAEGSKVPEIGW
jgi:hypothetical protein